MKRKAMTPSDDNSQSNKKSVHATDPLDFTPTDHRKISEMGLEILEKQNFNLIPKLVQIAKNPSTETLPLTTTLTTLEMVFIKLGDQGILKKVKEPEDSPKFKISKWLREQKNIFLNQLIALIRYSVRSKIQTLS